MNYIAHSQATLVRPKGSFRRGGDRAIATETPAWPDPAVNERGNSSSANTAHTVSLRCVWALAASMVLSATGVWAAPMRGTEAAASTTEQNLSVSCLIQASATVEVGTLGFSALDSVLVQPGDVVRKGQVLAVLDSRAERAAVIKAEEEVNGHADHASKRAGAGHANGEGGSNAGPAKMKLPPSAEQRASANAALDLARRQLAQRTITSPLSGVVMDRLASVQEQVAIIKIAKIDTLRVDVVMPGALLGSIKAGMAARVLPELHGTLARTATVASVESAIDAASNTFRAQLTLPNSDLGLRAGVRCKAEFATQSAIDAAQVGNGSLRG